MWIGGTIGGTIEGGVWTLYTHLISRDLDDKNYRVERCHAIASGMNRPWHRVGGNAKKTKRGPDAAPPPKLHARYQNPRGNAR